MDDPSLHIAPSKLIRYLSIFMRFDFSTCEAFADISNLRVIGQRRFVVFKTRAYCRVMGLFESSASYTLILHSGFTKSVALRILNRYIQKLINQKSRIPMNVANIHESIFFLLRSFGVQIARKSVTNHTIESTRRTTPKLIVISLLRKSATSCGSIPNVVTKNCACSGLKTIYARKLPKKMSATRKSAPIHLRTVKGLSGSFIFLGPSEGGGGVPHAIGGGIVAPDSPVPQVFAGVSEEEVSRCEADIISFKSDDLLVGASLFIEKNIPF